MDWFLIIQNSLFDLLSSLLNLLTNALGGFRCSSGGSLAWILHLKWINERSLDSISTLILDERDEIFNGTVSAVFDGGILLASGIEFEGGETANVIGNVIESSIAFGDDNFVGMGRVSFGELFVFRSKVLAMAALASQLLFFQEFTQGA